MCNTKITLFFFTFPQKPAAWWSNRHSMSVVIITFVHIILENPRMWFMISPKRGTWGINARAEQRPNGLNMLCSPYHTSYVRRFPDCLVKIKIKILPSFNFWTEMQGNIRACIFQFSQTLKPASWFSIRLHICGFHRCSADVSGGLELFCCWIRFCQRRSMD